ncbi:related to extracellular aspartic proteinase [Pseudozyma flocculosa]|uniref:Related to extracellular aspartic proteinase n=2 Tax=Pseudozyma flocculosa TaxID=84751 RepID=A0A5C3F0D2_9BASI|nr:related to extracellular aspartic proteinase [Pseudozyma flocculosa]
MMQMSARLLAFLLLLIYIGAIDVRNAIRGQDGDDALAPVGFPPSAAALPVARATSKKKPAKPRVGVVIKKGKKLMAKVNSPSSGGDGSAGESSSRTPQSAAKSDPASSFSDTPGRVGMTLQLKRLENPNGGDPLMLYQHHINRANAKLASMFKRAPVSPEQMQKALAKRRLSVLARRSIGLEARAVPVSASVLSYPPSRRSGLAPAQASLAVGQRHVNPRLGYTKNAKTGLAAQKRLLGGLLDGILGTGGSDSTTQTAAPAPVAPSATPTASTSPTPSTTSAATAAASVAPAVAAVASEDAETGFPESDLTASTAADLFKAEDPTAAQSLGLDIEANDIGYVVTVEIGSEKLPFRMLVDSGSADTWVPSTSCTECSDSHQRLGTSTSTTFREIDTKFSIVYGTGDVQGKLAEDSLTVAGMTLPQHTFGLAEKESDDFSGDDVPFEGLIGLAKTELSNAGVPTPIDALYKAGLVDVPVMGYHLGRVSDGYNDGEVTFGGVDPFKFEGSLTEVDNVSTEGFWEAPIDRISFGGKDLGMDGRTAILDTGTSLIVAPQSDADALHAAIEGSKPDGQGGYTIPCTTTASVSLTFGGREFGIDPRDLIFLPVDADDLLGDCVSAVSAGDVGGKNEWLVGAAFLKNVYFATNAKTNTIGLAPISQRNATASS